MTRIPVLISIPHGGTTVPPEVAHLIRLTPEEIAYYGDPETRLLYDFGETAAAVVTMPVSRVVVDVNRAPGTLPPENSDGAVKTRTVDGTPVWRDGALPDRESIRILLDRYYYPFHYRLKQIEESGQVLIGLDCHSMLPSTPYTRHEQNRERPLFCLSNGGDTMGESTGSDLTCPPPLLRALSRALEDEFGSDGRVALNDPYTGGFICRFHHRRHGIPWIQMETNRGLYEELRSRGESRVDPDRVVDVNRRLAGVLSGFWANAKESL